MTAAEWTPSREASAQSASTAGRIEDRLIAVEAAGMLADNPPLLANHDAIGIGVDFDRPPDGAGIDRVFVVVEAH